MSELSDNVELQTYSSAVLYLLSAVTVPKEYLDLVARGMMTAIRSSTVRKRSATPLFSTDPRD